MYRLYSYGLGSKPEDYVKNLGLELNKWGNIAVNERYQTSMGNIFGWRYRRSEGTVAWAAKSGREAAKYIIEDLK